MHQSACEDSRPGVRLMYSEQQSVVENSLFYDSVTPGKGSRFHPELSPRHGGTIGALQLTEAFDCKRAAIDQAVPEDSAECRLDTDLSRRAYLAASQADEGGYDKSTMRQIGRQSRRAEEARTQFGPDGSTPLRQQNIQLPSRVVHSKQDHMDHHADIA